jgi:hypothetical protein
MFSQAGSVRQQRRVVREVRRSVCLLEVGPAQALTLGLRGPPPVITTNYPTIYDGATITVPLARSFGHIPELHLLIRVAGVDSLPPLLDRKSEQGFRSEQVDDDAVEGPGFPLQRGASARVYGALLAWNLCRSSARRTGNP